MIPPMSPDSEPLFARHRQPRREPCRHGVACPCRGRYFRHRLSMRPGPEGSVNSDVHKACAELGITHMESLCNLEELIGKGLFRFIGLPLKIRNGSGGPMRAVAVLDE